MERKKFIVLITMVMALLLLGWGQKARSDSLALNKPSYMVIEGSTADGAVKFVGGGQGTPNVGGHLSLSTTNPAVATVTPTYVPFVLNSTGYIDMNVIFTLTGVSAGSTIVTVTAVNGYGQSFLSVYADVNVIGCPLNLTLTGTSDRKVKLDILHNFRDNVMALTSEGQEYIRLFYQNALEGSYLLLRYPDLRERTYKVLTHVLPVIEAAVNGQIASLSATDAGEIEDLMEAFAEKGSPKLQGVIQKIESDFHEGKFATYFGIEAEGSY
jgi:hypothetical protein